MCNADLNSIIFIFFFFERYDAKDLVLNIHTATLNTKKRNRKQYQSFAIDTRSVWRCTDDYVAF